MKHKRIINIQNPRLKKVRNEFRKLWSAAESSEWRRFRTKMEEIGKCLTFDELKEKGVLELYLSLQGRQRRLREDFRRSICTCYACGRGDIDMYYHRRGSVLDQPAWYCVACIGTMIEGYANVQIKKALGEYYCDNGNDFGKFLL